MKKSCPSQQQQQANSETKEAIHGNAKTQVVKSSPSSPASPPCSKVGDEAVPTGVDPKQSGNFHSQCQASGSHILATQSKDEARPAAFQASSAEETLDPTKIRPVQLKKGPTVLVSTGNHSRTQPLGDLNGQVPFPSRGNVKQSANGIQRAKVQDFKASPEAQALNHARHKKEKENIPPVLCTEINRIQDLPEVVTMGKSPEQKLLRALGKLPVCSTALAQPEATSVPEAVEATGQGNTYNFSNVEERYHEFMRVSGKATNALEINVLAVSELFARCVDPNSKNAQSNSTNHTSANKDKQHFEQRDTERSNDFFREYCPAPSFDLGIDDLPTRCADNTAHQHVGSSTFAEHEFKELPVHNQPIIDITDDDYLLDVEGIDEPCVQAEGNAYQTPEKSSNQGEVGSGSKIYSSSSSGEMHPHQFERRIIKPPPCKRSPFIDYNEKKVYMSKPKANRLYASVILHGRINEEESPDVDTSARVIEYGKYFVTVRELANSMKKEGFVLSHVMEVGIENIMMNLPPDSKKLVMLVRFSVQMQNMELNGKELISRFNKSNRLDRKDMIMFPVLENIDKTKPKTGNHYWIFNVNIRDRRFEALDSWRTLQNKDLDVCARKMVASFRSLWEEHYASSRVSLDDFGLSNIDVTKQNNEFDCGVFALTLANGWEARVVLNFRAEDIPSIRKQLTNAWEMELHWHSLLV
ncbi:hypothetical protein VPH35_031905 [Triticum aestivum]